jgi:hypothetical protein
VNLISNAWVYDLETYKNCFTFAAEQADGPLTVMYEISDYRNDSRAIIDFCYWLKEQDAMLIGFNNVGFDYPVLHLLLKMGNATAKILYDKAMSIIRAQDTDKFANMIYANDRIVRQLDLFRLKHYDNRARTTSLKALEFAMKMDNISDLPFPVGSSLNPEQIKVLKDYNQHDVRATKKFYHLCKDEIQLRLDLIPRLGEDVINANDTKIGAMIFQKELEAAGVELYEYGPFGRKMRQTQRDIIHLRECIPDFITFNNPEFQRIKEWFAAQSITETKGSIKDVTARVGGIDFVFGTGGMHASVENEHFIANDEWMIYDIDVAGLYPSIAITRGYYPEHLGPVFVKIYKENIVDERAKYKKGTPLNAAYKLAGNGAYGKSNDKYSIFFDPRFTMQVTISGQMMICMLAEWLLMVDGLRLIQCNTDGITMYLRRTDLDAVKNLCREWEKLTGLVLEDVEYQRMVIADVNSYLAQKLDGKTKLKGRYDWVKETGGVKDWHKDSSFLVVAKVAEQVLIHGAPIRETLEAWSDKYDFMGRVKVPRNSKLVIHENGVDRELENTQRYYISTEGGQLFKIMPPLAKKPDQWRRIGVESGWSVCPCNRIEDATAPVDYSYYQQEIEKLTLGLL